VVEGTEGTVVAGEGHSSNTTHERSLNFLALDVRRQRLGFVVFDGPSRLQGWGTRRYAETRQPLRARVAMRINALLDFYTPSAVVIRKPHFHSLETSQHVKDVIRAIRIEAKRRSADVHVVSAKTVKRFFTQSGLTSKHEIACTLAERFEEIAWKLPKERKKWQSERFNMSIFDAVAAGVAFFASKHTTKKGGGG
jgi:hypothetical protein